MASVRSASLNGALWAEPPGGRAPGEGSAGRSPLKLKAFCPSSYKKWPNVKDLNENWPSCLRHTASRSHDQPKILVSGGGHPVRP